MYIVAFVSIAAAVVLTVLAFRHGTWRKLLLIPAVILLIAGVVAAVSAGQPAGFRDQATLQRSVVQQADKSLSRTDPGVTAKSALCVNQSGGQWQCLVRLSDGTSQSMAVTVAANGDSWVTDGGN